MLMRITGIAESIFLSAMLVMGEVPQVSDISAVENVTQAGVLAVGNMASVSDALKSDNEQNTWDTELPELIAVSKPNKAIKLSWDRVDEAESYVLLRSKKEDGGFRKIYQTDGEACHYVDKKRVPGRAYYYRLMVYSADGRLYSESETVKARSLKKTVLTGISNVSGSRKLVLHWKPVRGASSYRILRKSEGKHKYHAIATVKGKKTSYTDKKRTGGKVYSYKVYARDKHGGCGGESSAGSQMAIDKNKKMIALTYDDGPSRYTPIVLNAIKKYRVHATFFVVGSSVNRYASSLRREVSLGCEIGNHTYAHDSLTRMNEGQINSVMNKTNIVVKKQSGKEIHIMRPPGGAYSSRVCRTVNMPIILWSVDTLDWKTRSTSATISCVLHRAGDGAVVLMHDLHKPTADAADTIIRTLKARGYQMVTVSELAAYRGGMTAGKVYNQFRRR